MQFRPSGVQIDGRLPGDIFTMAVGGATGTLVGAAAYACCACLACCCACFACCCVCCCWSLSAFNSRCMASICCCSRSTCCALTCPFAGDVTINAATLVAPSHPQFRFDIRRPLMVAVCVVLQAERKVIPL